LRASLGATRRRVFTQFVTESVTLSILGGAAGILLAFGMIQAFMVLMPPNMLPSEADVRISVPVLLFTFFSAVFAGILFGSAPAWQASGVNLNETLKEGGRTGSATGRHHTRRLLVVTEFCL